MQTFVSIAFLKLLPLSCAVCPHELGRIIGQKVLR